MKKKFATLVATAGIATAGVLGITATAVAAPAPAAAALTAAAPAAGTTGDGQVTVVQGRVALTVTNDSKEAVHVRMDGKSITGIVEKDLAPGESLRAAGHTLASSQDVSGTITYSNGDKVPFWGYNPDIGWPSVGFGDGSNWERFSVGETHHFTESGHQYSVHRNGDLDIGGGKDFQISVK